MAPHHFLVGTFNTPAVFTLAFDPSKRSVDVVAKSEATGAHSWLSLNADKSVVYATAWTEPPGLAAYAISRPTSSSAPSLSLINSVTTAARSGYCCNSPVAVYSAGGPTGEVFAIDPKTGGFKEAKELQKLDFVDQKGQQDDGGVMDFGGLRHGAHSADLSPDGKLLYIADIGRNCIFVYAVAEDGSLTLADKNIAPRPTDGPRHVWPHPNGRYVYSLQEHTSMVDVFEVNADSTLSWKQGVKIIPADLSPTLFWADEVRLSLSPSSSGPSYLFASTRGLVASQLGWVAVFRLDSSGLVASETPLALWETPTSGGWANAVEPAPVGEWKDAEEGKEYIALTDSEEGYVFVLSWDGEKVEEVARTKLEGGAGAATAVWLD
ncbi:Muconate cycloisomerase 1 [Leucosporidium creatinivorum]|uniref:Muconate cycloisomerase 1 n=1 Tax=Leucosporidium creatinivorum TaxID=106004 RepID=A0A1Y2E5U2_9BASI|nr:Muconate cycloisomerase 1 [Leucosporidium creatinivorum]